MGNKVWHAIWKQIVWIVCVGVCLGLTGTVARGEGIIKVADPGVAFDTPVKSANLDPKAFAEWCEGKERAVSGKNIQSQNVIWTENPVTTRGIIYGSTKSPGMRHLRVGLKTEIPVGTVFVCGGGKLSVLKPDAPYPGDLDNDSLWIPAQRLNDGKPGMDEVAMQEYGVWVLPPGTVTRALRFSHDAPASHEEYGGWLGGALVIKDRLSNVAEQAIATTSGNDQKARRINNEKSDAPSSFWDNRNIDKAVDANEPVISREHSEWIMLNWTSPVALKGLLAQGAGFGTVEVQEYVGPTDLRPRDAGEENWKTVGTYEGIKSGTQVSLWPNLFAFPSTIETRAVRMRLIAPTPGDSLAKISQNGRRVWLAELMALQSLEAKALEAIVSADSGELHGPIPIEFTLEKPGYVTWVIDDKTGMRVRNLVSETWFPAGKNVVWWDGLDDLSRDVDASNHGTYQIPAHFVEPGNYRARGLVRGEIDPRYEFAVYCTGKPPWGTSDHTGAWLANHTPPMAAAFVPASDSPTGEPAIYLGSFVTEGPDGLAWVDLDGRKRGGKKWIGGVWTGAPYLARDMGAHPVSGTILYVASVWETGKRSGLGELRVTAVTSGADKTILAHTLGELTFSTGAVGAASLQAGVEIGGLAVQNGLVVVSLAARNQLMFIDAKASKVIGTSPLEKPRGITFDSQGGLWVISGKNVVHYNSVVSAPQLAQPATVIASGLDEPVGMTLDGEGNLYVSDQGKSHQVKVFSREGKALRAIGKAGVPKAGPYDPLRMNNPVGLAIDSRQQLWVTENDYAPKRVSVWSLDGKFVRAFYGPGKYGGGGSLDSHDKTRFYYADDGPAGMEFKLDWEKGTHELVRVYYRPGPDDLKLAFRSGAPETALYRDGKRYFTNCYNSSPTNGHSTAFLFIDHDGIARPAAAMGSAADWPLLCDDEFKPAWPEGTDLNGQGPKRQVLFSWSDKNDDGQVQSDEVEFIKGIGGGVTVMSDLSFCLTRVDGKSMRYAPGAFTAQGVPSYDWSSGEVLASDVQPPKSSGGDQVLMTPDGWTVISLGVKPFSPYSLCGVKDGRAVWSYPNLWPGLHAAHKAPQPDRPGELIGPTRLLGSWIEPKGSDVGPIWGINGNNGNVYFFTADGLFVATVFKDMRQGTPWHMPTEIRNMSLASVTLHEENFWPSLSQTPDGTVYMIDGNRSSLVRLDGMNTIRRLPEMSVNVSTDDLDKSRDIQVEMEAARQKLHGNGVLEVVMRFKAPVVDGVLDDWSGADWAEIDKSGVKAHFNADSKPYDISGAICVSEDRLYLAYRTGDRSLLVNSGEMATALFKTGGALDLMIGTDSAADPLRKRPVPGDLRLLVSLVKGKPKAMLYRAVVPETAANRKVPFSSPWRTITFDKVEDVTGQIQFAGKDGNYEVSLPLELLGLKPAAGMTLKGDIGVLRGDESQTMARVYWSNKATGITSDVPSEAELTPHLWGTFRIKKGN